jgi:hypothetical protein
MEEVKGSNPFRSTKFFKDLAAVVPFVAVTGVHLESNFWTPRSLAGVVWPRSHEWGCTKPNSWHESFLRDPVTTAIDRRKGHLRILVSSPVCGEEECSKTHSQSFCVQHWPDSAVGHGQRIVAIRIPIVVSSSKQQSEQPATAREGTPSASPRCGVWSPHRVQTPKKSPRGVRWRPKGAGHES